MAGLWYDMSLDRVQNYHWIQVRRSYYRINATTSFSLGLLSQDTSSQDENLREMFFVIQLGKAQEHENGHRTTNNNGWPITEWQGQTMERDDNTRKTQERWDFFTELFKRVRVSYVRYVRSTNPCKVFFSWLIQHCIALVYVPHLCPLEHVVR